MPDDRLIGISHFLGCFADGVHNSAVHSVVGGDAHSGTQCDTEINSVEAAPASRFAARRTACKTAE